MSASPQQSRAAEYARRKGIEIDLANPLGAGTDGAVWKTNRTTAVKAFERQASYELELQCYFRFHSAEIDSINGFAVPRLMGFNEELLVIEMGIVSPPFIIDFAKVRLDRPYDFSEEVIADWNESGQELFEERWPQVKALLWELERFGIYYMDAKPGNIMFGDES